MENSIFVVAAVLSLIGLLGLLLRKNLVVVIMSLEVMLLGAVLALIAAARLQLGSGVPEGALLIPFVLVIAAAEVCIGLTLVMKIFKAQKTLWIDELDRHETEEVA